MILRTLSLIAIAAICLSACSGSKNASSAADNTLSSKEQAEGWQLLFDGKSIASWHSYRNTTVNSRWKIADNSISVDTSSTEKGDLVTNDAFENYHLSLDWKISTNGNSGIIFDVQDDPVKYEHTFHTGPEVQVLDNNGHPDAKVHKHRASDLYDLIASSSEPVKPANEWNHAELIQTNNTLEIKLNGVTTVKTAMWDENWKQLIAGSKFKNLPDFGAYKSGHIALQDHGNEVWYKNIKIKKL